jgi:hypothetical protein
LEKAVVLRYHDDIKPIDDVFGDAIKLKAEVDKYNGWVQIFW